MLEATTVLGSSSVRVRIAGADYHLSLDLGDLAQGERWNNSRRRPCNLLIALPLMRERAFAAIEVFSCSLHAHHPKADPIQLFAQDSLEQIIETLNSSWPASSLETVEANRNLCFDLDVLAEASEYFAVTGNGMPLVAQLDKMNLAACLDIFPCALRRFRPELSFVLAQKLMDRESVAVVAMHMSTAWRMASPEEKERFSLRAARRKTWTDTANA